MLHGGFTNYWKNDLGYNQILSKCFLKLLTLLTDTTSSGNIFDNLTSLFTTKCFLALYLHRLWTISYLFPLVSYDTCNVVISKCWCRIVVIIWWWYDARFALGNWQASCPFNLAHKLKRTENDLNENEMRETEMKVPLCKTQKSSKRRLWER